MSHATVDLSIELELGSGTSACKRTLHVIRIDGEERIGAPYRFSLQVVTSTETISEEVVGGTATLRFLVDGVTKRTVRAVVQSFEEDLAVVGAHHAYRLTIAPRFAELARFVTQDVHVGQSYPEVIRAKLGLASFTDGEDFAIRLGQPSIYGGAPWTDGDPDATLSQPRLVVQYRESDLAFLSRIAEHVGIGYFFEDGEEGESLVFTDHVAGYASHDGAVPFDGDGRGHGLFTLSRKVNAVASSFYVYDYSYRAPATTYEANGAEVFDVLGGESHLSASTPGAHVEYAPNAKTADEAAHLARIRADAEEGTRERFSSRGPFPGLYPGVRFHLENHPSWSSEAELLVVASRTTFVGVSPFGSPAGAKAEFSIEFDLVRAQKVGADGRVIPFRPQRLTPRPRIHGVVTGVVRTAPPATAQGHQHLDAQGRYLVRLHFDQTEVTMPRLRMAQPHVGESHGHHFPLRPGAEVVVAFLDGDPDRPVILGAVPNPLKRSPVVAPLDGEDVELSRIKTRSGIRIEMSDGPKS